MKMKMRMILKRPMVMKTTTAHAMKRRSQASRARRPRITETVCLAVGGIICRENAPSMIFGYLDRGSLGPGLTGAKSGCGPGDQGFKNRIINGSKPVGLRTRLVNNQEIFDVNVAVLVKFFTRNAVGTAVSITESLYSIAPLLLFLLLILHDSLNNKP
jgi:hypothetical protein